jgi:hypothetical protein
MTTLSHSHGGVLDLRLGDLQRGEELVRQGADERRVEDARLVPIECVVQRHRRGSEQEKHGDDASEQSHSVGSSPHGRRERAASARSLGSSRIARNEIAPEHRTHECRCARCGPRLRSAPSRPDHTGEPVGGVAERLKAHAWKACLRATVTWVRIPLPPPISSSPSFAIIQKTPNLARICGLFYVDRFAAIRHNPDQARG